jgi:hypothetical protein
MSQALDLPDYESVPGDVVLVSPDCVATIAEARAFLKRLGRDAMAVVCGKPESWSWLDAEDGLGPKIVAILGSTSGAGQAICRSVLWGLARGSSFGLRPYIDERATIEYFIIGRGNVRQRALAGVKDVAQRAGVTGRVASNLLVAVEGLVLQALTKIQPDALDEIELPRGREIRLTAAFDDRHLAVSVGELATARSLRDIKAGLRLGVDRSRGRSDDGALELATAVRASTHVTVNLIPQIASEVICLVSRATQSRGRAIAGAEPSFAVFVR